MADNPRKVSPLKDVVVKAEKQDSSTDEQGDKSHDLDQMADSPDNTSQPEDVVMKMEKDDSSMEEEFKKPLRPASSMDSEDDKRTGEKKDDGLSKAISTKRRPHSKSRRGCITCKRRRVKCDETHPMCKNCEHLGLECSFTNQVKQQQESIGSNRPLNMIDLRLFYHYTSQGWRTITEAGIHGDEIWGRDVPMLAFNFPFLMHAILTFSATHLSRTHSGVVPENVVTVHRGDALNLLRQEVKEVTPSNLDALVAASILLILDSLANASSPDATDPSSLPASAWLHHVRGAATILISVQPLPPESRFNELVNIDLSDLAEIQPAAGGMQLVGVSGLECFDEELRDLYPVSTASPYFQTLMFLDKLYHQQNKSDFILRVFSFPALIDKSFIELLVKNDQTTRRIIKVYYKLVREFAQRNKESVWFLEGVARVLPIDMDSEFGGLGFITSALPVQPAMFSLDKALEGFDAGILAAMQEVSNGVGEDTLGSGMQYFHDS